MSRPNPRSLILGALAGGPQTLRALRSAVVSGALRQDRTLGPVTMTVRAAHAATDRHLCKLLRARRVVHLTDGRYCLRLYKPTLRNLAAGRPLRPYALISSGPVRSLLPPGVPAWADQVVGLMKEPRPAPRTWERVTLGGVTLPAGTLKTGDRIQVSGTIRALAPEPDTFTVRLRFPDDDQPLPRRSS